MRAVLYTHDMIPITVMDVPREWWKYLEDNRSLILAVQPPLDLCAPEEPISFRNMGFRTVRITIEPFIRNRQRHWFLFTHDEESALLLRSTFLPGQHKEVKMLQDEAFAKGFWRAIQY